jgi:integrase
MRSKTFPTKAEARTFAAGVEIDTSRGALLDPRAGRITLDTYVEAWFDTNPQLAPRTVDAYRSVYRLHVKPHLGDIELTKLSPGAIREWRATLVRADVGAATQAKAYRFVRVVLNTAVTDAKIATNPCQIRGAGSERAAERPIATPAEIMALADATPDEYRCMVLLAGFCALRLGEALGLHRRHVNLLHNTITIEGQLQEFAGQGQVFRRPKTDMGYRTIPLPATVADELQRHLENHAAPGPEGYLFTGALGGPLRRGVWQRTWTEARDQVGLPHLRYHDLRHSALTLLSVAGGTLAEVQAHGGHASPAAAMRYQHAAQDRAHHLARLIDRVIEDASASKAPDSTRSTAVTGLQ